MTEIPTWLFVVAAAVCRADGRWLLHRRPPGKHHGGLWEFPGGKVEEGETPKAALRRELGEELGLRVRGEKKVGTIRHAYTSFSVTLHVFLVKTEEVQVPARSREGLPSGWFSAEEARNLPMPAATVKILSRWVGDPETTGEF